MESDLKEIRRRRELLKRFLLILFAFALVGLPLYTIFFFSRLDTANRKLGDLKTRAETLSAEIRTKEHALVSLSSEKATLGSTLQRTREELDNTKRRLADAQKAYDDFKNNVIDKATFFKRGLGMYTATDRFADWRKRLGEFERQGDWDGALRIADLIGESHAKDPSAADASALALAAGIWRRVASMSIRERAALKDLPPEATSLVLRQKAANAYTSAIDLVSEPGRGAPDYLYGNAGINLMDIASDGRAPTAEKARALADAEALLRKAVSVAPNTDAWLQRLIQVTERLKRSDPRALRDFCLALSHTHRSRSRCAHAISEAAYRSHKRRNIDLADYQSLTCDAASLAPSEEAIKKECSLLTARLGKGFRPPVPNDPDSVRLEQAPAYRPPLSPPFVVVSPAAQGGNSAVGDHTGALSSAPSSGCSRLGGSVGVSMKWGSGWMNFEFLADFPSKTKLRLGIGGSARKVLVQLSKKGESPDQPVGILGQYDVPSDRVVEVTTTSAFQRVTQISVHGGARAWDWNLGAGNGPASLLFVERCQ